MTATTPAKVALQLRVSPSTRALLKSIASVSGTTMEGAAEALVKERADALGISLPQVSAQH
jgi:uncharacterized protein (DUF1778 family)